MATIYDLSISITGMGQAELYEKFHAIRANRRRKPERAMRAKKSTTPAKVARAPRKSNLKQQDIFAFTNGMSDEAKAKLAAELLNMGA